MNSFCEPQKYGKVKLLFNIEEAIPLNMEINESLILSWLQHVKKCQSVQINWKPLINSWELHNEEKINQTLEITKNYFLKKGLYSIFPNKSSQLDISQLKAIDVLGLKVISNNVTNIYGVTIASEEELAGENITATMGKIIEKMVSTALLMHGYFNMTEGQIIFASPKINSTLYQELDDSIKKLNSLYKKFGFRFTFFLYANDSFKNKIYKPTNPTMM